MGVLSWGLAALSIAGRGLGQRIIRAACGGGIGREGEVGREVGAVEAEDDETGGVFAFGKGGAEGWAGLSVGEDEDRGAWHGAKF